MTVIPALLMAATVVAAATTWVRPPRLRPGWAHRSLPSTGGECNSTVHPCPAWFAALVQPAALPLPAERVWLLAIGGVVAAAVAGFVVGGPAMAILLATGVFATIRVGLHAVRHRLDQLVLRGLPDTLDSIARSTRSGRSVVQALGDLRVPGASPADLRLASVATKVERGVALETALADLARTSSLPGLRLAVTALVVGSQTGAAPARAVEGVAITMRDRLALERELAAQASQSRASVAVLVLAPLAFALFAIAIDPRVGQFLFRSPLGWTCLALGLGLDGAGAWWMRQIMDDVR